MTSKSTKCCTLKLADYTLLKEGIVDVDGGIILGCPRELREPMIRLYLLNCHLSILDDACRSCSAVVNAACLDLSVTVVSRAWLEEGFGVDLTCASGELLG